MHSVDELKPCAHCGETPCFSECADYIRIWCSCGIQTQCEYGYDKDARKQKVIEIWNRRI